MKSAVSKNFWLISIHYHETAAINTARGITAMQGCCLNMHKSRMWIHKYFLSFSFFSELVCLSWQRSLKWLLLLVCLLLLLSLSSSLLCLLSLFLEFSSLSSFSLLSNQSRLSVQYPRVIPVRWQLWLLVVFSFFLCSFMPLLLFFHALPVSSSQRSNNNE